MSPKNIRARNASRSDNFLKREMIQYVFQYTVVAVQPFSAEELPEIAV